jgi:hypothetical protein
MGNVLKNAHPGSFLLCIDTWLGGMCIELKSNCFLRFKYVGE